MMTSRWSYRLALTRGDKMLIAALLLVSVLSIVLLGRLLGRGSAAVVEVDGQRICCLDLSVDGRRAVTGRLGDTVIQIRDGRVRVIDSPCPHKLCVRMGWVERAGGLIVCVPNRVVVRVEGDGEGEVDATTW
jgi:hypothetical protein